MNLEGVFTAGLARLIFKEHYNRRIVIGMIAIILGGVVLGWAPGITLQNSIGLLIIAAACISWAVDNNLTRKISLNDPILITMFKNGRKFKLGKVWNQAKEHCNYNKNERNRNCPLTANDRDD